MPKTILYLTLYFSIAVQWTSELGFGACETNCPYWNVNLDEFISGLIWERSFCFSAILGLMIFCRGMNGLLLALCAFASRLTASFSFPAPPLPTLPNDKHNCLSLPKLQNSHSKSFKCHNTHKIKFTWYDPSNKQVSWWNLKWALLWKSSPFFIPSNFSSFGTHIKLVCNFLIWNEKGSFCCNNILISIHQGGAVHRNLSTIKKSRQLKALWNIAIFKYSQNIKAELVYSWWQCLHDFYYGKESGGIFCFSAAMLLERWWNLRQCCEENSIHFKVGWWRWRWWWWWWWWWWW